MRMEQATTDGYPTTMPRYYFIDGHALTGWQYVDGYKFYFDSYGRLVQNVEPLIGKQSTIF